jgi:hypothetical protein
MERGKTHHEANGGAVGVGHKGAAPRLAGDEVEVVGVDLGDDEGDQLSHSV